MGGVYYSSRKAEGTQKMSFDPAHQIFQELTEDAERYLFLKKAILISYKRDPVVRSVKPLIDWMHSRLIREREWRVKAEDKLKAEKQLRLKTEAQLKELQYRKKR